MFNTCGNSVRNHSEMKFVNCQYSSTELAMLLGNDITIHGKLVVLPNNTLSNSTNSAQVKSNIQPLLKTSLSLLSTTPIITKKKYLKEI